jgi:hypothetical protein
MIMFLSSINSLALATDKSYLFISLLSGLSAVLVTGRGVVSPSPYPTLLGTCVGSRLLRMAVGN